MTELPSSDADGPARVPDRSDARSCDLCGLKLPPRPHVAAANGSEFSFCCAGCRHVFLLLKESGLLDGDFRSSELYRTSLKLGIIGRPDIDQPDAESPAAASGGASELILRIDGMWCSSCAWLIEKVVADVPGVEGARVMYASDTARIHYRPERVAPDEIAGAIGRLGYSTTSRDAAGGADWPERKSLLLRMGVALFLMTNLMMFSYALYVGYFQELPEQVREYFPWILLGFTLPSVFWCAVPIHRKAWGSLVGGAPTMELLFSIGIFAAFFYSVYGLLTGGGHFYFDTAGSLVGLLLVGKFIELSAKHRTSENINRLYRMMPKKVRIRAPEGERLVSVDRLAVGDRFIVKSGEKVPADGTVVGGRAIVDESLITGESTPIEKAPGAGVVASSMNVNGVIEVEATRIGKDTLLASIIELVERALSGKSEMERIVDRIARVFVPAVIGLAALTGVSLALAGAGAEEAVLRSITVLVIACPCVLGMATPLAIAAGIGYAARRGIFIRDGSALQLVGGVDAVVFDKTGTLTEGRFTLLGSTSDEHLRLAAALEQSSSHPIARALVEAARTKGPPTPGAAGVRIVDGRGIEGTVGDRRVVIGNEAFLRENGFNAGGAASEIAEREAEQGHTIVFVGIGGEESPGVLILGDSLKPSSENAVGLLKRMGVAVRLLSGDLAGTTAAIARRAGIGQWTAPALPSEKVDAIRGLQAGGKRVAFAGDGVNDAPALAQADVGIAMGTGTEMAMEAATITLLRDDLSLVPEALDISKRSFAVVKQNLAWAYFYNFIGIVLAVAGWLNPFIAAVAMLASSISVVLNSMRLSQPRGMFSKRVIEILFPWIEPSGRE